MTTKDTGETDMPERIWAKMLNGEPRPTDTPHDATAYIRSDLVAAKDAEITRLQQAVVDLKDELFCRTHGYSTIGGSIVKHADTIEAARKALGRG